MPWWNSRSARGLVAVESLAEGLAVAWRRGNSAANAPVAGVELLSGTGAERQALLRDLVSRHHLQKAACSVVLRPADYQMLLVEAPQVPDEEMRSAIRWRLKDLVSIPLESAVVDFIQLPADGMRGGRRMMFAVVTERGTVESLAAMVGGAHLQLSVIDIGEMALRNLSLGLADADTHERGLAVVRIHEGSGSVSIYRDGNLYLSRQFELQYAGGLLDDLPAEDLVLEIQRSVDYYERQMGQAPPAAIYLCGENLTNDKLTASITSGFAAPVQLMDFNTMQYVECEADASILQTCAGAVGGVLRREAWS